MKLNPSDKRKAQRHKGTPSPTPSPQGGEGRVRGKAQSKALRFFLAMLLTIEPVFTVKPVSAEETLPEEQLTELPGMSQPVQSTGTVQEIAPVAAPEESKPLSEPQPEPPAPLSETISPGESEETEEETAEPANPPSKPDSEVKKVKKEPESKHGLPLDEDQMRVTLDIKDAELHVILNVISQQTGANFIATERLKNLKFTAYLRDVTLDYVLRSLLEANGLAYERVGDSNIYVVKERTEAKPRVITRVYVLKYIQLLDLQAGASGGSGGVSGVGGSGGTATASLGGGVSSVLKSVFSEYGKLELDPRTNSIIITELPEKFTLIEELIQKLDIKAPQVLIEVEVVEVNANVTSELGVSFGGADGTLFSMTGASGQTAFPLAKPLKLWPSNAADETGSITNKAAGEFKFGNVMPNVTTVIQAIVRKGHGRFLARPKIMTINNKSAEIHITEDTAVNITSNIVSGGNTSVTNTSVAERAKTGVTLLVTPQVNADDFITLALEPNIIRSQPSTAGENIINPQTRGVKTSVRVKDGHTILIGGLMSNDTQKTVRKTPLLGDIPLLGLLFTYKTYKNVDTELLVFITPRIIRDKSPTELSRNVEEGTVNERD